MGDHDPMSYDRADPLLEGRNETPLQRCDRNMVELLQELRVVLTGVQVLFAFLLMAPLSARFPELAAAQRLAYFVTLASAGAAAVLLMAPTAYHRILFRCGDKDHLVTVSNRYTLAGLVCVALAMLGSLLFVSTMLFPGPVTVVAVLAAGLALAWCWCVAPLLRRRRIARRTADVGGREAGSAVVSLPARGR